MILAILMAKLRAALFGCTARKTLTWRTVMAKDKKKKSDKKKCDKKKCKKGKKDKKDKKSKKK
jgi:hypothetical protein